MWTSEIKPQCILHVAKSRNISIFYVVDIFLSSSIVERHIFSNRRVFLSFINHCSKVIPAYNGYNCGLSFTNYNIFAEELTAEFTFRD